MIACFPMLMRPSKSRSLMIHFCLLMFIALTSFGCSGDIGDFIDEGSSGKTSDAPTPEHVPVTSSVPCHDTFDQFKRANGPAGKDRHWHHIVEQHDYNKKKFTERRLNCEDNLIAIDKEIHYKISGHYSKLRPGTSRQTVREWLRAQSWTEQRQYGLDRLRQHGISP